MKKKGACVGPSWLARDSLFVGHVALCVLAAGCADPSCGGAVCIHWAQAACLFSSTRYRCASSFPFCSEADIDAVNLDDYPPPSRKLLKDDVEVHFVRSGGAGGQNVNKGKCHGSCCTITHLTISSLCHSKYESRPALSSATRRLAACMG
jgi:hypothetical protein